MRLGPRPQPRAPSRAGARALRRCQHRNHAPRLGAEPRLPARPSDTHSRAGLVLRSGVRDQKITTCPPSSTHLQLASRDPNPPTLTWSRRPTPAWREDPRPARGEGGLGPRKSHARPAEGAGRIQFELGGTQFDCLWPSGTPSSCIRGGRRPQG